MATMPMAAAVAAMEVATAAATAAAAPESAVVAAASLHDKSRAVQAVFSIITPRTRSRTRIHMRTHTTCTITTPTWPTMTTAITASATTLHPAQHKTIQGIISAHSTSHPSSSDSIRAPRTSTGAKTKRGQYKNENTLERKQRDSRENRSLREVNSIVSLKRIYYLNYQETHCLLRVPNNPQYGNAIVNAQIRIENEKISELRSVCIYIYIVYRNHFVFIIHTAYALYIAYSMLIRC